MYVSSFALKSNLASVKTELDKLDINKLTSVPNDLSKLSNVVKNDVVKNTECNKLKQKHIILILQILLKKLNMKKMGQILKIKSIR